MKPLALDLCAGLGGWTEGFLAEGWDVIGFDIERHQHGTHCYPAHLVVQDILTLDGRQFCGRVQGIVASPPCQKYSYMAMPWTRAKALALWYRDLEHPERIEELNRLFSACFRIAEEAECPIVLENVRGAQPWVGRAMWHYGSYYLWGDVPALMPIPNSSYGVKAGDRNVGRKSGVNKGDAFKQGGDWFSDPSSVSRQSSSQSKARKAASAMIAKIPFRLSRHIASVWNNRLAP